jgi:glycosyltransferase involved in cell wall biosynthesis
MASRGKILMLTTDRVIDRRIVQEADSLDADGWQVTILAPPARHVEDHPRVIRIGSHAAVAPSSRSAALLRTYQIVRSLVPADAAWLAWLRNAVWRHAIGPDVFLQHLFTPAAEQMAADIVVAHDLPVLAAAAAAARFHKAKLAYDSHELYCEQEFPLATRRMWSSIERREIHACEAVITINPSIAGELARRYGLSNVHVIHNAARADGEPPPNRGMFHRTFALDPGSRILLFQGGVTAGRNLETLVDAMTLVTAPGLHLVFLGGGQLEKSLRARAGAAGIGGRVHFHRSVHPRDLLDYTACADLGIIPYQPTCLNNLYCTPNKLFEFIAAGLPMIATDLPELRRLVVENGIGRVADTSSPAPLAAAIDGLARHEAAMQALRRNVAQARRRMNWECEEKTLIDIYRRLGT